MRPIEVGDWVEPIRHFADTPRRALVCRVIRSTIPCLIGGPSCQCDGLDFVGFPTERNLAWAACCFVPIFPKLCESTTDVEEPVHA